MSSSNPSRYLTVKEAAAELRATPASIYNYIRDNRLAHVKPFGKVLIPRDAIGKKGDRSI